MVVEGSVLQICAAVGLSVCPKLMVATNKPYHHQHPLNIWKVLWMKCNMKNRRSALCSPVPMFLKPPESPLDTRAVSVTLLSVGVKVRDRVGLGSGSVLNLNPQWICGKLWNLFDSGSTAFPRHWRLQHIKLKIKNKKETSWGIFCIKSLCRSDG